MKRPEAKYRIGQLVYFKEPASVGSSREEYWEGKIDAIVIGKNGLFYEVMKNNNIITRKKDYQLWGTEEEMFQYIRDYDINWMCDKEDHIEKG